MADYDFDLLVIGAGSGGVRAARLAAMSGAKVAVVEESRVGGTCVIRGCVPKKFMVYASEYPKAFEIARGYGWDIGDTTFDWPRFLLAKDIEIRGCPASMSATCRTPAQNCFTARPG